MLLMKRISFSFNLILLFSSPVHFLHSSHFSLILCVRLGPREAPRGLDEQLGGMLPALRGPDAQPASQWVQRLGHVALAADAARHALLRHHLATTSQPAARRRGGVSGERRRGFPFAQIMLHGRHQTFDELKFINEAD